MEAFLGTILPWPSSWAPDGWALCQGQTIQITQNQALYSLLGVTYGGNGSSTFNLPDLRGRFPVGVGQSPGSTTIYELGKTKGTEQGSAIVNSAGILKPENLPGHTHTFAGTKSDVTINVSGSADLSNVKSSVPATTDLSGGSKSNIPNTTLVLGPAILGSAAATICNVYYNQSTNPANNIKVLSNPVSGTASVTASGTASITPAGTVGSTTNTPTAVSVAGSVTYSTVSPCLPINFIIALQGLYPMRP